MANCEHLVMGEPCDLPADHPYNHEATVRASIDRADCDTCYAQAMADKGQNTAFSPASTEETSK